MARTVERIDQEIAELQQSIEAIAQKYEETYRGYLTDLGHSVRRQLISAAYHVCTQGYPERFLHLSYSQQQALQQSVRDLAKQTQDHLLAHIEPPPLADLPEVETEADPDPATTSANTADLFEDSPPESFLSEPSEPSTAEMELAEPEAIAEALANEQASNEQTLATSGNPSEQTPSPKSSQTSASDAEQRAQLEQIAIAAQRQVEERDLAAMIIASLKSGMEPIPKSLTPLDKLVRWQKRVEEGIQDELQSLSQSANKLLHHAEILPNRVPEPILEIATKAGAVSEPTASPPNLMNLVIEAKHVQTDASEMLRLIAVRLRLSEIEFGDTTLATWRSQLRSLASQLNQLGRQYRKTCKEKATAQAELAWRASWFDE
ncbi:hypothetical protein ACQ4M4_12240 [Leptolyngbya sp. AN02str]|uniref:hypothetical protein n=1 Tax=Leptolyngbya sp. AN02str TaxID=3423363 RepID=UPI003D31DE73